MEKFLQIESTGVMYVTRKNSVLALKDVSLSVAKGEFVSLMGAAGSGKSTLLGLISGLQSPSEGAVIFDGKEIVGPGPERVMLSQGHTLLPWLTCFENVYLAVERVFSKQESKSRLKQRTQEALAKVNLNHAEQKYPHEITGDIKLRVGVARALAMEPKVLLMDDPFAALDALTRAKLQDELIKIVEATHATVVMVTHDVDEAVLLSDRIVMMTNGPAATIGEIYDVKLPRPRDRMALANDPTYVEARKAVLSFLYEKQGHVEKLAA